MSGQEEEGKEKKINSCKYWHWVVRRGVFAGDSLIKKYLNTSVFFVSR